jgi:phosphoribosylformylglycinamidine synthase
MSTNAVSICKSVSLSKVTRIESSVRYLISFHGNKPSDDVEDRLVHCLHDKMTQCRYLKPVETFELDIHSEPVYDVDIIGKGRSALEKANKDLGKY